MAGSTLQLALGTGHAAEQARHSCLVLVMRPAACLAESAKLPYPFTTRLQACACMPKRSRLLFRLAGSADNCIGRQQAAACSSNQQLTSHGA